MYVDKEPYVRRWQLLLTDRVGKSIPRPLRVVLNFSIHLRNPFHISQYLLYVILLTARRCASFVISSDGLC